MVDPASIGRPLPVPDPVTAPYWAAAAAGHLSMQRCDTCELIIFPPKYRCPTCLGSELNWTTLSGRGRLHSFATMHMTFVPGFVAPFLIGVTELAEQPHLYLCTNLVECQPKTVRIGMELEAVFESVGGGLVLPQFRPMRRGG